MSWASPWSRRPCPWGSPCRRAPTSRPTSATATRPTAGPPASATAPPTARPAALLYGVVPMSSARSAASSTRMVARGRPVRANKPLLHPRVPTQLAERLFCRGRPNTCIVVAGLLWLCAIARFCSSPTSSKLYATFPGVVEMPIVPFVVWAPESLLLPLVGALSTLAMWAVTCVVRRKIRARDRIPTSCCHDCGVGLDDACCTIFCMPCTQCQYAEDQPQPCSPSALSPSKTQGHLTVATSLQPRQPRDRHPHPTGSCGTRG